MANPRQLMLNPYVVIRALSWLHNEVHTVSICAYEEPNSIAIWTECFVLAEETSELLQDSSGHPQGPDQLLLWGQAAPGRDTSQDEVPAAVVRQWQLRTHLKVQMGFTS